VIDNIGDQSLQPKEEDYIRFPGPDSDGDDNISTSGSDDLEVYDSDKDYSWYRRYRQLIYVLVMFYYAFYN
jgi:hypothetical protein